MVCFLKKMVLTMGSTIYDTGRDIFLYLHGKEYYRTTGFKEIALIYGDTEKSYRKTAKLINRIRYQEKDGTPAIPGYPGNATIVRFLQIAFVNFLQAVVRQISRNTGISTS